FRLKSINLHIPPLRERKSDVKVLFNYFVEHFCKENKVTFHGIDEEAMDHIINYAWTGNARELKNFCESIIVLYPDRRLNVNDVKKHLRSENVENSSLPAIQIKPREQAEKDFLIRALIELKADIMELKDLINRKKIDTLNDNSNYIPGDFTLTKEMVEKMSFDEIEKQLLGYLLKIKDWNINEVAKILDQTPRNIYRKIKSFGLTRN
ncbi:hypothetical protein D4R20_02235, partial [bacterium]